MVLVASNDWKTTTIVCILLCSGLSVIIEEGEVRWKEVDKGKTNDERLEDTVDG